MRREELVTLVEGVLEDERLELVECSISRTTRSQTFRISIDRAEADREGGVSIEACARVSRKIATLLDGNPLLHGQYQLEVASAGMNRPIWRPEHFIRFEGEPVTVELSDPGAKPRFVHGILGPRETGPQETGPQETGPGQTGQDEPGSKRTDSVESGLEGTEADPYSSITSHGDPSAGFRFWLLLDGGKRRLLSLDEITKAQLRMDPWKRRNEPSRRAR